MKMVKHSQAAMLSLGVAQAPVNTLPQPAGCVKLCRTDTKLN